MLDTRLPNPLCQTDLSLPLQNVQICGILAQEMLQSCKTKMVKMPTSHTTAGKMTINYSSTSSTMTLLIHSAKKLLLEISPKANRRHLSCSNARAGTTFFTVTPADFAHWRCWCCSHGCLKSSWTLDGYEGRLEPNQFHVYGPRH